MMVFLKNYSEGFLSVKFPYSMENVEKIKKINGRKWIESDKIWSIPNKKELIKLLFKLFEKDNIVSEMSGSDNSSKDYSEDIILILKNELKLRRYSVKTQKAYLGHVKRFLQFCNKRFEDIDKDDIKGYLLKQIDEDKSSAYIDQAVSALRFLYVDVKKISEIEFDISRPKREQKLPSVLNMNEVFKIIEAIENLKHKTIIMLIYSAGLRVSEAAKLRIEDIDSKRNLIYIRSAKGKKDRYTLLSNTILEILRQYFKVYKPENWLFQGQNKEDHITERSIQKVFEKAVLKAGIKKKTTVHTLRHPYVKATPKNILKYFPSSYLLYKLFLLFNIYLITKTIHACWKSKLR